MYKIYLGELALPIAPAEIKRVTGSRNEVISLINGGELNIIKGPKLTEFRFEVIFPYRKYPFSSLEAGYMSPMEYIGYLETMKEGRIPFYFKIIRLNDKNMTIGKTENIFVSLESFSYCESAENGIDIKASITLKEYRSYGTEVYYGEYSSIGFREGDEAKAVSKTTYIVKEGDTLWDICKGFYGDGEKFGEVAKINGISNPNRIYMGQVIRLE